MSLNVASLIKSICAWPPALALRHFEHDLKAKMSTIAGTVMIRSCNG